MNLERTEQTDTVEREFALFLRVFLEPLMVISPLNGMTYTNNGFLTARGKQWVNMRGKYRPARGDLADLWRHLRMVREGGKAAPEAGTFISMAKDVNSTATGLLHRRSVYVTEAYQGEIRSSIGKTVNVAMKNFLRGMLAR